MDGSIFAVEKANPDAILPTVLFCTLGAATFWYPANAGYFLALSACLFNISASLNEESIDEDNIFWYIVFLLSFIPEFPFLKASDSKASLFLLYSAFCSSVIFSAGCGKTGVPVESLVCIASAELIIPFPPLIIPAGTADNVAAIALSEFERLYSWFFLLRSSSANVAKSRVEPRFSVGYICLKIKLSSSADFDL